MLVSAINSPTWMIIILTVLILAINRFLSWLKNNEGPMPGIRSVQIVLAVLTGLMVYFVVRMFVG